MLRTCDLETNSDDGSSGWSTFTPMLHRVRLIGMPAVFHMPVP